jgi:hypothetical protein
MERAVPDLPTLKAETLLTKVSSSAAGQALMSTT